jgi:hypothetical protein
MGVMRVWLNNRVDSETQVADAELAAEFWQSEYADLAWPFDRALRTFLTVEKRLTWDEGPGFTELSAVTWAARPQP